MALYVESPSGQVGLGQSKTSISRNFTVPSGGGSIEVDYKVSSEENFDWLRIIYAGVERLEVSGEVTDTLVISGLAAQTSELRLEYEKDVSDNAGDDTATFYEVRVKNSSGTVVETHDWSGSTVGAAPTGWTVRLDDGGQHVSTTGTTWEVLDDGAGSGPTGTLSETAANATLSASGTQTIGGTLAETTANATLAASGTQTIGGTLSETTADATLAASGTQTIGGTLSETTADATLSASGEVGDDVSGSLSETLGAATLSASGTQTIGGTLAETLAASTLAASGTQTISGSLAETLGAATLAASGTQTIGGSLAETTDAATLAASGTVSDAVSGSLSETLAASTLSAAGTQTIGGTLAETLDAATVSAAGDPIIAAALAETLDAATLSATGEIPTVTGSLTETLAASTVSASGTQVIGGSLAETLEGATLLAVTADVVIGTVAITLDGASLAAGWWGSTQVAIVNLALLRIGIKEVIETIDDGSEEADLAAALWDGALDTVLAVYPWAFATKRELLAEIEDATRTGWRHVYEVPSDCVSPRYLYAGTRTPQPDWRIPFALELGDDEEEVVLCSDLGGAELIYTCRVTNPAIYPPPFVDAFAWFLAAEMALPLAARTDLRDQAVRMWELMRGRAEAAAANEQHEELPATTSLSVRGASTS